MQKSANMYYKPFFVSLMYFSGSTVIFCSLLTFVHVYKQCHLLFCCCGLCLFSFVFTNNVTCTCVALLTIDV